jgi:hypothetical protein
MFVKIQNVEIASVQIDRGEGAYRAQPMGAGEGRT